MSASPISRLICNHDFYWSRRRQADVCRRCGALSPVMALHFRSKAEWTVGADLPPERVNGFAPAVDVEAKAAAPDARRIAAPADLLSLPAAAMTHTDFSNRDAATLRRPLVT